MLPSPCPSTAEVIAIQFACEVARQEHSRATATDTVPVPPVAAKVETDEVTFGSHREEADGPVTLVDVELPQATAAKAHAAPVASQTDSSPARAFTTRAKCMKVATIVWGAWYNQITPAEQL